MSRLTSIITILLLIHLQSVSSSPFLAALLKSPEPIDPSKPDVNNAELVVCTDTSCVKVESFKVETEGLTCHNRLLEITFSQKLSNGTSVSFPGFIHRHHGLLSKKQEVDSNCIVIKRFYLSNANRIVCIDDICHKTPKNQMDHVIIIELLKQLRFVLLTIWSLGYYDEEKASIHYYSAIKVRTNISLDNSNLNVSL